MEIKKVTNKELIYIPAICLDPSVGKDGKEVMSNAMDKRIDWIKEMMKKGLELFIALEEPRDEILNYKWLGKINHRDLAINDKVPMGLLESIPIEYALEPIAGKDMLFINCMWILPPFWGKGVGTALLTAFRKSAQKVGAGSVIAYDKERWFDTTIEYMPMNFFKKNNFIEVDRDGGRVLMFLDIKNVNPPTFLSINTNLERKSQKLCLNIFCNDQCPWSTYMVKEFQEGIKSCENIEINIISTNKKKTIEKFGISRGVVLNNNAVYKRMVTWEQVKQEIDKLKSA
ncbi:MAG: GNAT family N-acetyltransferase [Candidatus Hermodarchaeota archaeon]